MLSNYLQIWTYPRFAELMGLAHLSLLQQGAVNSTKM